MRIGWLVSVVLLFCGGIVYAQDTRLQKAQEKINKLRMKVVELESSARKADSIVEVARGVIRAAEDTLKLLSAEEESIKRAQFDAEKRARRDVNDATDAALDSLRLEYRNVEKEIDSRIRELDRRGKAAQRFYENGLKGEKRARDAAKKAHGEKRNAEKAVQKAQEDYVKLEKSLLEKKERDLARQQKKEDIKQRQGVKRQKGRKGNRESVKE